MSPCINMVRKERLELSRLTTLEPKSSVSTNSTTPARCVGTPLGVKNLKLYLINVKVETFKYRNHQMTITNAVSAMAGAIIMASLLLNNGALFAEASWLWLTFFVGFNLFQSAFTGFCPASKIFKSMGAKD
jgi:hypothetical protein